MQISERKLLRKMFENDKENLVLYLLEKQNETKKKSAHLKDTCLANNV